MSPRSTRDKTHVTNQEGQLGQYKDYSFQTRVNFFFKIKTMSF